MAATIHPPEFEAQLDVQGRTENQAVRMTAVTQSVLQQA